MFILFASVISSKLQTLYKECEWILNGIGTDMYIIKCTYALLIVLLMQATLIYARPMVSHVGGAESAMATAAEKLSLQMEAQKLADRKTEFVVNSKEELVGIMKCTACKRVILQLHSQIIGRVSTEGGASVKKITKRLSKMIKKICQHTSVASTPEIVEGCKEFIKENRKLLLETYIPRTLEDHDFFEERFPVTQFCRTETTACPEGIQSLDELLGKKIDEQRAEDAKSRSNRKSKKRNVKKQGKEKTKVAPTNKHTAEKKSDHAEKNTDQINENINNEDGNPPKRKKRKRRRRRRKRENIDNTDNSSEL